ncbi:LEA type 2 family protein [Desulfopila sp. IMCC35008]|uniref:LEA type 2 family protein n=1 Tax=Desulfopila sp. IMCC35008 TaxID=2653858 RepID=UPI0013D7FB62|nr:LEA type 2 family protein [Desulfopila sp. IMCC35008]
MKRIMPATIFGILFAVFMLSGCAGVLSNYESPQVTLADLRVQEIKPLETSFLIQLRVANPNDSSLEITGLSCDLELDNTHFASGLQGERRSVAPYSSALVPVEVHASMLNMVSSVLQWLQAAHQQGGGKEAITYGLTGHVRISNGTVSHKLPFESTGELNLQQLHPAR